jgi:acetyl esterase/lipase
MRVVGRGLGLGVAVLGVAVQFAAAALAVGPEPELLWPDGAPGAVGDEEADRPSLRVYLPPAERATGAGIVVCPGGGYAVLAMDHEGHQVAQWLNSIGVAAFVVQYRLGPRYHHPAPLEDAQRAIRTVRARAEQYGVSPDRVGILGFSAGGHLASTAATHFDSGRSDATDEIDRQSCRPDFAVLCYPVISFTEPFAHAGSRNNLLGENPDPALVESLSNEKQVSAETPPTFLFHTGEDTGVPVENSLAFYAACRKAGVPAELHVYQHGPHGVGLAPADPAVGGWKDRLADWLRATGVLASVERAAVRGTITIAGQPLRWGMVAFLPAGDNQPRAWGMVSRGQFALFATSGPVLGENRVAVYNLGAVEPRPTLEAARAWDDGSLRFEIKAGENELSLDLPR